MKEVMKYYKDTLILGCLLFLVTATLSAQVSTANLIQKAEDAGIQRSALMELQARAQDRDMSEQQLQQIIQSALEMSEQNLPADFVVQKALEGLSKGIPGDRIAPVIERVRQSTAQAVMVIDPWLEKPEVQRMVNRSQGTMSGVKFRNDMAKATSKSLMQNISTETVVDILNQIGTESLLSNTSPSDIIVAMGILPDLPTTNDQPQVSGSFIVRALKEGFKANDLQKLPSAMNIAQQRNELPAASVLEGVAGQMRGGIPAKQILQNLFNGNIGGGPPGNIPRGLENRPNNQGNGNGQGGN